MKRNALVLLSALLLLTVSSSVFAYDEIVISGDCDGWTMSATLMFGEADEMDIEYAVDLYDDSGTLVYHYYTEETIHRDNANFTRTGSWDTELCGDQTLHIALTFYGPWGTYTDNAEVTFTCECLPQGDGCTYPPIFWARHPDKWPVEELTVGCETYTKAEMIDLMFKKSCGDITIRLFRQLVAAKLNVLNGADDSIEKWITAGDDFLCEHPYGSRPCRRAWRKAFRIKLHLFFYNWRPCNCALTDGLFAIEAPEEEAATEETSWGSIKKMRK